MAENNTPQTPQTPQTSQTPQTPQINLKIEKKIREDDRIQLTITVPADMTGDVLKSAAYVLAMQNKLDPAKLSGDEICSVVREAVGEAQYKAFTNYYAMSAVAPHAISLKQIEPIMEPGLSTADEIAPEKDFTFAALVTPKPHYELSSYEPVTVVLPTIEVTDEEIDAQIFHLSERSALVEAAEGEAVSANSEVTFAVRSAYKEDAEVIPQLTAEKRIYPMGKGYLPADFDEQLIGMKAGESKTFDFGLPISFNPDGSVGETRTATTTIDLTQVNRRVVPAINDAWILINMPEVKNMDGLREMFRKQGTEYKTKEQDNMKFFSAASELASRFIGVIPDEIYESTRSEMLANMTAQLKQQGMTLQHYLQSVGMDMQQFDMNLMIQVRETLRQGFALDALARHLKLTLSEEDLADTLTRMSPGNEERLRAELEGSGRSYILTEAATRTKANKWLVENATFETVE
ncbi:MAG: hypothetical protein LBP91_03585 [Coriobacteriales bacterium]|jgi:trigger factor|nr:hypothetical protein [Coriobacteriales bacterium]